MADGKLVFLRPADGSGKLVFGDTGGAVVVPPAELSVDCGIAGDGEISFGFLASGQANPAQVDFAF